MRKLGTIVRLQVQQDSIKSGSKPFERYTPVPNLTSVSALRIDSAGVHGIRDDGNIVPDVHNADHPRSKFRGDNGISIGFTGHYAAMRERFGDHLTDGVAGENILVDFDEPVALEMIQRGVVIRGEFGDVTIGPWVVAHPCAPFSRFCLQFPHDAKSDRRVTETLQFLENGMRGFTATYAGEHAPVEIRLGDVVYTAD